MKNNTRKNIIIAFSFGLAIASCLTVNAQINSASAVLSNNIESYSINSTEDYLNVEQNINALSLKIKQAYAKYPNMNYTASYNNGEIAGFIITGVPNSTVADELSFYLMQIEVLSTVAMNVDEAYLPVVKNGKLSRVSRKDASK